MKKKPQTEQHTLRTIIYAMKDSKDSEWWEIMGVEIPGIDEELAAAERSGIYCHVNAIESSYLRDHIEDLYEVWWPEHCIHRYFNSDATYRLAESSVSS